MDDFRVEFSEQVRTTMADDPAAAEFLRDHLAQLRQAMSGIDTEDPEAVAAVMEMLGAVRVDPEDLEEDDGDEEEGNSDFRR